MTLASSSHGSSSVPGFVATAAHRRRLREVWRSAGWPYQDPLEAELVAAGLLQRERDDAGRDSVRVTDAGVDLLAQTLRTHRAARAPHDALVARVAREMQRAGRVVWLGLSLRARVSAPALATQGEVGDEGAGILPMAPLAQTRLLEDMGAEVEGHGRVNADLGRWVMAMPDVYSIRHTTVEDYLAPTVHEIKVNRADLLDELRRPSKGEAYRWLAAECWFVIRQGIAEPEEIPSHYGVLVAPEAGGLVLARAAPHRRMRLPFPVWMALARAAPEPMDSHAEDQALLGGWTPPPVPPAEGPAS